MNDYYCFHKNWQNQFLLLFFGFTFFGYSHLCLTRMLVKTTSLNNQVQACKPKTTYWTIWWWWFSCINWIVTILIQIIQYILSLSQVVRVIVDGSLKCFCNEFDCESVIVASNFVSTASSSKEVHVVVVLYLKVVECKC